MDQIRRTEPPALAGEADAAKAMLAENANADQLLIEDLRDAIGRLGKVGGLDGARIVVRGKLPAAAADLRGQVNEFAALRAQQIDSWAPDPTPTFRDAARHLGVMAENVAVEGRRIAGNAAIDGWAGGHRRQEEGRWSPGGLGQEAARRLLAILRPGAVSRCGSHGVWVGACVGDRTDRALRVNRVAVTRLRAVG